MTLKLIPQEIALVVSSNSGSEKYLHDPKLLRRI